MTDIYLKGYIERPFLQIHHQRLTLVAIEDPSCAGDKQHHERTHMITVSTKLDGPRTPSTPTKVSTITISRSLSELRRERGMSQKQLADAMGISQPSISRQEKRSGREDIQISSLRSVIAAMGGRLEVIARFPEGSVKITDCSDIDTPY